MSEKKQTSDWPFWHNVNDTVTVSVFENGKLVEKEASVIGYSVICKGYLNRDIYQVRVFQSGTSHAISGVNVKVVAETGRKFTCVFPYSMMSELRGCQEYWISVGNLIKDHDAVSNIHYDPGKDETVKLTCLELEPALEVDLRNSVKGTVPLSRVSHSTIALPGIKP